jgi:hypothetical protein
MNSSTASAAELMNFFGFMRFVLFLLKLVYCSNRYDDIVPYGTYHTYVFEKNRYVHSIGVQLCSDRGPTYVPTIPTSSTRQQEWAM